MHQNEFLPTMVGILERLSATALARDEPLLASLLSIAKTEAEDALRHQRDVAALAASRAATSSVDSWRPEELASEPCDDPLAA